MLKKMSVILFSNVLLCSYDINYEKELIENN